MKKIQKRTIVTIFWILIGNLILAFAIAGFVLPESIIAGGTTGLAITIKHYFEIDITITILIVNIILFCAGTIILGKSFAFTTVISTCCYPIFLSFFRMIIGEQHLTSDRLLAVIYAGILMGLGVGLVLRMGASTGGMDIPPLILNQKKHIPLAGSMYTLDTFILLSQVLFSSSEQILYGILLVILTAFVINYVILLGNQKIQLFIISKEYPFIRDVLLHELDLGVTMINIETAYEGKRQQGVLCVTSKRNMYQVMKRVQKIDDKAFITISQTNEVRGRGFSLKR